MFILNWERRMACRMPEADQLGDLALVIRLTHSIHSAEGTGQLLMALEDKALETSTHCWCLRGSSSRGGVERPKRRGDGTKEGRP